MYTSASEVVREALPLIDEQYRLRKVKFDEHQREVRKGLDSGASEQWNLAALKMKRANTSPRFTPEQIKAAIKAAPDRVHDPDCPYDLNDRKEVAAFFKDAVVTRGGGYAAVQAALAAKRKPGQRGPGKRPSKEVINIRLSPDVLSAFRATGDGWQTRVDGALRDWLKRHEPKAIKARRAVEET